MFNLSLIKVIENTTGYYQGEPKLIESNNFGDYVYTNEQYLHDVFYGDTKICSILWQNGHSFKGGDYNCPSNEFEIYAQNGDIERAIDGFDYLDDEEQDDLIAQVSSLIGESVTIDDIEAIRDAIYSQKPMVSGDVEEFNYDVDIIEWAEEIVDAEFDYKESYPVVKESKNGVSYDEYYKLCKEYGFSNVQVTSVKLA